MEYRHGIGRWMVKILHIMLSFLEPGQYMKVINLVNNNVYLSFTYAFVSVTSLILVVPGPSTGGKVFLMVK